MRLFTVACFGHRHFNEHPLIEGPLNQYIRDLLAKKEYVEFLVGRNGEFDQCMASCIRRAKKEYRCNNSALVLVLPYLTAEYLHNKESFENYYDAVEIPYDACNAHPKAAISIRNKRMVDRADSILCFVKQRSGGAYKAMAYAQKLGKEVINMADR